MFVFTDNELKGWKKECRNKIRELKHEIIKYRKRLSEIHMQEHQRKEYKKAKRRLTKICKQYGFTLGHAGKIQTYILGISDKNVNKHFGGVNPLVGMEGVYHDIHILLKDIQENVLPKVSNNV